MFTVDINCPDCGTRHDVNFKECPHCHKSNDYYEKNRVPKRVAFMHPVAQLSLFGVGFSYAGMFLIEFLFGLFLDLAGISDVNKLLILGLSLTYCTMFAILLSIILSTRKKYFFEFFTCGKDYGYGVLYALAIIGLTLVYGSILNAFGLNDAGNNANQQSIESVVTSYPIFASFILCIIGPICEELTYRVGLYSFLRRINKYLAIIVTTIVFAFIHLSFSSETIIEELISLPSYLIAGAIFAIAYEHRGPACSITAHIVYNMFAVMIIIVNNYGYTYI